MSRKRNYAYVDGSFNPQTNVYGGAGILIDQRGKKHVVMESGNDPDMAKLRNVAGEILGAKAVMRTAINLGMRTLTIYYDYEGIANWINGKWRCKKPETKEYANFVACMITSGLKLYFQHVKSHTGVPENEEVDKLAKYIVGLGGK